MSEELMQEMINKLYNESRKSGSFSIFGNAQQGKSYAALSFMKYFEQYLEEEQWKIVSASEVKLS